MDIKQILEQRAKEMTDLLQASYTKQEFTEAFQEVIRIVKEMRRTINLELGNLDSKYTEKVDEIKSGYQGDIDSLKSDVTNYFKGEMDKLIAKIDTRVSQIKDGKDADVNEVARLASEMAQGEVLKVIPKIDDIENDLPKLGASIRDGLELLEGDERLEISAIKDLEERLEELKNMKGKLGGGGGFNYGAMSIHIVDDETPTGDINGVNTDFVLNHAPSPTGSLKVFVNGQRMRVTEDYTLSGQTITFLTAPLTGSIILCDYRI